MHRLFREMLEDAKGESQRIIVVFIDIRRFSEFSQQCDSVDVAAFIRKVYMKIIDAYFSYAAFYKSTGDGLLFAIQWEDENLEEMSEKVIGSCINCHSEFGTLFDDDPSINFDVPTMIGIGVARGSACCLVSGDKIIDYSGRLLNLASRLTAVAKPSGIVIDGGFNIGLLSDEQRSKFEEADVYLDGIAEDEPIQAYFTKEFTTIPQRNRQPIALKRWCHLTDVKPFRDILKLGTFQYVLESEPVSADDVKVTVEHNKVVGGKVSKKYATYHEFEGFTYKIDAGKPVVVVDFPKLCRRLERYQVKKNMNVSIEIAYIEK